MASERIEQSRAQLGIASSLLLPSVGASAGYSREAISEHGKFAALGAPTSASDFWQLGFDASWELDLWRSEEHTSELQSLMRISYAVFCLKKKTKTKQQK